MEKSIDDKLKLLDIENAMYIFFIASSLICINANEKVRNKYLNNEKIDKSIQSEYLVGAYLALIVFIVFMERNYDNLKYTDKNTKEYDFEEMRLFGSTLIVFGQLIAIYYLYNTDKFNGGPI